MPYRSQGNIQDATQVSEEHVRSSSFIFLEINFGSECKLYSFIECKLSQSIDNSWSTRFVWDPSCGTLYPQKLELTLPTSGGRLAGIVLSLTEATEFLFTRFGSRTKKLFL
jgi:hypothetical protein